MAVLKLYFSSLGMASYQFNELSKPFFNTSQRAYLDLKHDSLVCVCIWSFSYCHNKDVSF